MYITTIEVEIACINITMHKSFFDILYIRRGRTGCRRMMQEEQNEWGAYLFHLLQNINSYLQNKNNANWYIKYEMQQTTAV
jgi:hypothetical protein